jgi:regulatory protein
VRRRRLGPYRPQEERAARRQRDLGALARAGFSFDVARRALEISAGEELSRDD